MRAFFWLAPILLAACAHSSVDFAGRIDPTPKSITMPPGSRLLIGPIKQGLRANGWQVVVEGGPVRTTGKIGTSTVLETGATFKTRYRLSVSQHQLDICLGTGMPMITYDLSLIDNQTGEEVITTSGKDCVDLAAKWFVEALSTGGQDYCANSSGRSCASRSSSN